MALAMSAASLAIGFLGYHRINKDLFKLSIRSFHSVFIISNYVLSRIAGLLCLLSVTREGEEMLVAGNVLDVICFLPVITGIGTIDALRLHRSRKIPVLLIGAAMYAVSWADAMYGTKAHLFSQDEDCIWGIHCSTLLTAYKTGNYNLVLFHLKAVIYYLHGHGLAIVRPWYDVGDCRISRFESSCSEDPSEADTDDPC